MADSCHRRESEITNRSPRRQLSVSVQLENFPQSSHVTRTKSSQETADLSKFYRRRTIHPSANNITKRVKSRLTKCCHVNDTQKHTHRRCTGWVVQGSTMVSRWTGDTLPRTWTCTWRRSPWPCPWRSHWLQDPPGVDNASVLCWAPRESTARSHHTIDCQSTTIAGHAESC